MEEGDDSRWKDASGETYMTNLSYAMCGIAIQQRRRSRERVIFDLRVPNHAFLQDDGEPKLTAIRANSGFIPLLECCHIVERAIREVVEVCWCFFA